MGIEGGGLTGDFFGQEPSLISVLASGSAPGPNRLRVCVLSEVDVPSGCLASPTPPGGPGYQGPQYHRNKLTWDPPNVGVNLVSQYWIYRGPGNTIPLLDDRHDHSIRLDLGP